MSHTFQILKNPPEYTMQYSVQPGRNTQMMCMLIFWEMRGQLHGFHVIHSQNFTTYNSQSLCLGPQLTLPKRMGNNTIFLIQKVPSWKHAFPGTPGMHMIELMIHNQNTHHKLTIGFT